MTEEDKMIWRRTALEFATKDFIPNDPAEARIVVRNADLFYNFLVNGEIPVDKQK